MRWLACLTLVMGMALAPILATAQDVPEAEAPAVVDPFAEFERIAERAEDLAALDTPSQFAISRLRAELVVWRDQFLVQSSANAGRLDTLAAQLEAIGPPPEDGSEPDAVTQRRDALSGQRDALLAPRILAAEAHARASGLIAEFDAKTLQQQTARLTERGAFPLTPDKLLSAGAGLTALVEVLWIEISAAISARQEAGVLWQDTPRAFFLILFGIALLGVARPYVGRQRLQLAHKGGRWLTLRLFALSLLQITVPLLGLFSIVEGLQLTAFFGMRGGDLIEAIPLAGTIVIGGWWLTRQVFPTSDAVDFFGYSEANRRAGRFLGASVAWVMGLGVLIEAGLRTMDLSQGAIAAITWVLLAIIGLFLWRLGRMFLVAVRDTAADAEFAQTKRRFIGRVSILAAFAGVGLATLGYLDAGEALLVSWSLTLALAGVVYLLQGILGAALNLTLEEEAGQGALALLPVFLNFVIYLAAVPFLAILWGAGPEDLAEVWTRFIEGFSIGEIQIAPSDFVMLFVAFGFGYALTRFIQSTLRKTVLPRTRLDKGGQNAIVAGVGYVGMILAALVAITVAGIDLSNIAIVAGALSVGIGFGLQNIVSNFVSGIILLIERPISEGDWIEAGGQMGYVRSISVRSTRIETFDRTDVIIPNADLVSGQVTNWTRGNLIGRVIVPVGVAYGTDVDKVIGILTRIAEAHPMVVMTPPPAVLFQGFGADSLDFEIRAILRDVNYVLVVKSELNQEINKAFTAEGIEIPFAQRDIWLRNPEVLHPKGGE